MTVTITLINRTDGDIDVHAPGCRDIARTAAASGDTPWTLEVASALDMSLAYWGDVISDQADPDSEAGVAIARSYIPMFHILPCCPALPEENPAMTAHLFAADPEDRKVCVECGKTRNAKDHKDARVAAAAPAPADEDEVVEPSVEEEAARQETDRLAQEKADEHADAQAEHEARTNAEKAAAATAAVRERKAGEVSLWVGWRVAEAVMARTDGDPALVSLAAKLHARPENSVRDRTVRLNQAECEALAAVGTDMENEWLGRKGAGPVVYSVRTMRARLAAIWAS